MMINTLHVTDRAFVKDLGWLYVGPAPFDFDKSSSLGMAMVMDRPRVVNIDIGVSDGLWRATWLESYATWRIPKGSPIGLLVRPWVTDDTLP